MNFRASAWLLFLFFLPCYCLSQTPEILIQNGHSSDVLAVAFSADGKTLASASSDETVKLWDAASGTLLRTLEGHSSIVFAVAFSADGKTLASASGGTVKLWDAASGTLLRTLEGHSSYVTAVAFSTDRKTLASASWDDTVKLWDVASGNQLRTLEGHSLDVLAVAFSANGKTLASGSEDRTVKLWNAASGTLLRTLDGHSSTVKAVAFSIDGKTLASANSDTVKLWNAASGTLLRTLEGHPSTVKAVAFSADGKTLASGSEDRTVKLWDVTSGNQLRTLEGHSEAVEAVAFSADGKTLASGSRDHSVKLWDAASENLLHTLEGHSSTVKTVVFSADGKTLASGSWDRTVKLWDATSGTQLRTLEGHSSYARAVAFSADGKTLASASWDDTVKLWDAASGTLLRTLEGHSSNVTAVAFFADGKTLASASWDDTVKLWDAASGTLLRTLEGHSSDVYTVAFSANGKTLASGSSDGTVKLWDAASGTQLRTLEGHSSAVLAVAFSADGKTLASASLDHTVKLWEAASGTLLHTLEGHSSVVYAVAFSADGKTLASGSEDTTIRIWNSSTGRHSLTLLALDQSDWIAWTPEGYYDASANGAQRVSWRVGNRVSSFEKYEKVFHKPGMIKRALGGESLPKVQNADDERPGLTLLKPTSPSDTSEIELVLQYQGKEFEDLAFLFNGKPLENLTPQNDGTIRIPLTLVQYKNTFHARVRDKILGYSEWLQGELLFVQGADRWVVELDKSTPDDVFSLDEVIINGVTRTVHHADSIARTLSFLGGGDILHEGLNTMSTPKRKFLLWREQGKLSRFQVPYAKQKSYAIIAAIDDYQREKDKVRGPTGYAPLTEMVARAEELGDSLVKLGFPAENIFRLYNQRATKATLTTFLEEFWEGGKFAGADRLFFYFGGHGDATKKNGFLITYDFDPNRPSSSGLLMRDLTGRHFQNADVHHFLIALDSCSAGLALPKTGGSSQKFGPKTLANIRADTVSQARDVLVAGTGEQRALVRTGGVFTSSLIAALKGHADENGDGVIQFYELAGYVRSQVVGVAGPLGVKQVPDQFEYDKGRNLFLRRR